MAIDIRKSENGIFLYASDECLMAVEESEIALLAKKTDSESFKQQAKAILQANTTAQTILLL